MSAVLFRQWDFVFSCLYIKVCQENKSEGNVFSELKNLDNIISISIIINNISNNNIVAHTRTLL